MSQSTTLLRVRDLQVRVGEHGVLAVDGLSFDMAPGAGSYTHLRAHETS